MTLFRANWPAGARATWLLVPLVSLATGCGGGGGPHWIRLARLSVDRAGPKNALEISERSFQLTLREDGEWLEQPIREADWSPAPAPGRWSTPLGLKGAGRAADGSSPLRLTSPARRFEDYADQWSGGARNVPPGSFFAAGDKLFLQLEADEPPPAEATLAYLAQPERGDGIWRVVGRRFSGEGWTISPGASFSLTVSIPEASALSFATTTERASLGTEPETHTFRVRLDGEVLFEEAGVLEDEAARTWHRVTLPADGRKEAQLTFEVEGPFAFTSFLMPMIAPAEVGGYGARPWEGAAPDLVVLLADTFRADNMALYGGELGLTPNLDRFAEECLRFERAWSVSTHTLPAHATMFAGLYPHQMGVRGRGTRLPEGLETIAELLSERGYRTGAITDSGMVSQFFGLAQGFQWWDERRDALDSTFERAEAFLEADDGRPLFLFVQTYRVHGPYEVSEETRGERGEALGIQGDYESWNNAMLEIGKTGSLSAPEGLEALDRLRSLYHGGVVDFDRGFEGFRSTLERLGLLESGYLVFTSDHGESFGEHVEIKHSGPVYDEQSRIPLLIRGPGIEPGDQVLAASLIDLTPTVADLAGLAGGRHWKGTSLLELDRERPLFLFQCKPFGGPSTVGVIDRAYKVIGHEAEGGLAFEDFGAAFDLESDPGELSNRWGQDAWAEEVWTRWGPVAEELLVPVVDLSRSWVDSEHAADLEELGYGGGEE